MVAKTNVSKGKQVKEDVRTVPESLKTAYEVHTLAHMLYGHLAGTQNFGQGTLAGVFGPSLTHGLPAGFETARRDPCATGATPWSGPAGMPGHPLTGLWIH